MSLDPDGAGSATTERTQAPHELSMTVVEYTSEPDRCTVSPRGLSGVAKLSTWMTVNKEVVVGLAAMR
ncbi:hypothetical protein SAMN05443574_11253 [Haloarcula vallismortis]|uniref:DUF7511 domain-containing protein n=2 Tax=Haloarcula vallismortis TaxID=28442 RepID=M0J111_HALVA|nr:hypothetical protein [Haloarcula vallismortis]EMA01410.1 hypothetical protein C437_16976 [Haloarcula vallismortis ATCC 29715]SDX02889.1 hypothetical protein SAMN05443574_11253 [Haloarcula vallismortis]